MALPVFRAASAKAAGTGAVTPALPAGMSADDIVILCATTVAGGSISITANGSIGTWNAITGSPIDVTGGQKLYVWWGRWASGTTGPTCTPGSDHCTAGTAAWSGCITDSTVINNQNTGTETTSDTSFSFATGISSTVKDCMVLCVASILRDSNTASVPVMTNASLANLASRLNFCTNLGAGGGFGLTEGQHATAGSMGTFACTYGAASPKAYIAFALRPPNDTTTKTQTGKARVTVTVPQTQTGKARVQKTVGQTTTGKAKIAAADIVTSQTTTGKARVQKTVPQTQPGTARVQKTVAPTTTGVARVQKTIPQDTTGKARVTAATPRTIEGKARLEKSVAPTTTGRARIQLTIPQTTTGRARIEVVVPQGTAGKARVQKSVPQDTTGVARVQQTVGQTQTGVAKIAVSATTQTTTGKARIQKSVDQTQPGTARVQKTVAPTQAGTARIQKTVPQAQSGQARVQKTVNPTQPGTARIQQGVPQTQSGTARIQGTTPRTTTGKGRVQVVVTQNQTGVASIISQFQRTQTGKARVQGTGQQTIAGRARIRVIVITGTVKTNTGVTIAGAVVKLFLTANDVLREETVSDANGLYSFAVPNDTDEYYVVAYKVNSPDKFGTTVNTLVGI